MKQENKDSTAASSQNYGEAMEELNQILDAIEEDRFDLDELGAKVGRAAALIKICREKIDKTELQIKSVMNDLDEDEDEY